MNLPTGHDVTRLLLDLKQDSQNTPANRERLLELVYAELRGTARRLMSRERLEHTLQPTALVHEAWMRIVDHDRVAWTDRAHFLGIAARCMRQVLVDHARRRAAEKRGGGQRPVTLIEGLAAGVDDAFELIALDDALRKLAELDARAADVAERRIFAGMTVAETAHDLNVSKRTVDGDWSMARLWLAREMADG